MRIFCSDNRASSLCDYQRWLTAYVLRSFNIHSKIVPKRRLNELNNSRQTPCSPAPATAERVHSSCLRQQYNDGMSIVSLRRDPKKLRSPKLTLIKLQSPGAPYRSAASYPDRQQNLGEES
jgi:hypothetical protein